MTGQSAETTLRILDEAAASYSVPMLDNGYLRLAASRLTVFHAPKDWAMVFAVFGYSSPSLMPVLNITTVASRLPALRGHVGPSVPGRPAIPEGTGHEAFESVDPVSTSDWRVAGERWHVADSGSLILRGRSVSLPPPAAYAAAGVIPEGPRPTVMELCLLLADMYRADVLATDAERRRHVLPEMEALLTLDEWHHPDLITGERPSDTGAFRQLAQVAATGDPGLYVPREPANTHWRNWPGGGTL